MQIPQLVDNDGYPTEEWLEFIKKYNPSEQMPLDYFIQLLNQSWWMPDFGFVLRRKYKDTQVLELHTGGWSGNESIVEAIKSNFMLSAFYIRPTKWLSGGHHYFQIRLKENQPSIKIE